MSTAITHLKNKKMIAPKLRFKGFDDSWEKKTLFDISENLAYGMNAAATDFDGKHKYIRITDIDVVTGEFKPDPLTSPLGDIDEKFRLKVGDIVFARTGASVGKSYLYNPKDGELYYAGFLIKFSITKANPYFLYTLTLKEAYNKWVHIYSMRSGQPGLNAEEYKALKLNIPSLPEQQKIAGFLSAVDEKIQLLNRKKQLLEQYKKGVMQQLFSGELRFKDSTGKAFPKWEEKKLGEIGKLYAGGDLDKLDYRKEKEGDYKYPIYANGAGEGLYGYASTFQYKANCVTVSGRGNLGYANMRSESFNAIVRLIVIEPKEYISTKFLEEIINNINFVVESTGVPQLTVPQISSYKIIVPSLEEQKKIADFLSAIDVKIEKVAEALEATAKFKKGLLQQMFV